MKLSINNIIEELLYGNIDPLNGGIFKPPEMKELIQYIARYCGDLKKTLTDEQKEVFEKFEIATMSLTDYPKHQNLSVALSSVQG